MSPADARPVTPTVDRRGFWLRTLLMYDLVFVGMTAVYLLAVLTQATSLADGAVPLTTMSVLALAYAVVGRRAAQRGSARLADGYLVVLLVVVVVQVADGDIGSVLLFLGFLQIWFFSRTRVAGVVWAAALTLGITTAAVLRVQATGPQVAEIAAEFGTALLFAVVLGLWITRVAEQSEERAYLLDELRATQEALAASHHAAGVVAERQRLAAEIHDTLAQGFTSVVMLAETAAVENARGHVDRVAARLEHIEGVARDNLAEARTLVAATAPPDLQDGTLADALVRLAVRFGDETGVRVDVVDDTGDAVGAEAQVVLLRAAQESLANVRRHAGASHVRIGLAGVDDEVVLEIVDDGRGLPQDVAEGHGLRGMRARADAAGGTLEVTGQPGVGTRLRLRVPDGRRATTDPDRAGPSGTAGAPPDPHLTGASS
ncbi:sensor histidine kinase [Cellulomonas xiejunii]|uniref:Sensor histidine kinase n=1 Tax=Cellulomonas xiejunii TaxID=2968083 RepID=A0ABY5KK20_9CELL|nr:sensor histidine kinase [Cellulomonas xiejunii]MCC2320522.1 sensor histidine kinase [Cellulomonas xiejunii]UUI70816.1 sensor histidine kinase [Cellulomonas xiejunii]